MEELRTEALSADQTDQIDTADSPKPEDPDKVLPSPKKGNLVTITILVILIVFGILFIVGLASRYSWISRISRLTGEKDSITLISSKPVGSAPTVLVVVRRNGHSEVRTLNADTGALGFVSSSKVESFAPVHSPVTNKVAYFTRDEKGRISLVVGQPGEIVTDTVSVNTLEGINRTGFELCDYAQVVWSTDGQRIATFVCNKQSKESYLLVTEIGGTNEILEKTRDNLDRVRSVVWISSTHVVYTQNEKNLDVVYLLDMSNPNQPTRLFGP